MAEDLVLIARIGKAHGIKGEVSLTTYTFDDNRFKKLKRVLVKAKDGVISERGIESVRLTNQSVLMKFAGCDDRNAAEELRGAELLIPESERPKLPKGRAYYDQIIGMKVVDDENGTVIGEVKNVLDMPASDVFVLDLDGTEHLLSNAGEEVKKIDIEKKELRVKLLEPLENKSNS
jgi:16S rRNA processing protein RimM